MSNALELHDSRISHIELDNGMMTIQFSHAYIHKSKGKPGRDSGTGWSQEAVLILYEATLLKPLPDLPGTISEAYLEVGGIKHELIPLPFKRKVAARFWARFENGCEVEIMGNKPIIELHGNALYLEDY